MEGVCSVSSEKEEAAAPHLSGILREISFQRQTRIKAPYVWTSHMSALNLSEVQVCTQAYELQECISSAMTAYTSAWPDLIGRVSISPE